MFHTTELAQSDESDEPWILSTDEKQCDLIPGEVTKLMRNYQMLSVEFLYRNYKKELKGSILNEDEGMNFPLQISAFLRAVLKNAELVLVICPDERVCPWHYHLTQQGNLKVQRLTQSNCQDKLNKGDSGLALLLSFSDVNLAEDLLENDFFAVIIDKFDLIANKKIYRKLSGHFNIGLSHRNFYKEPDQKLKWNMLNWTNPGCVGKLADFYEADSNNVRNFHDGYKFWWLRLTWNFCKSFQKPSAQESEEYASHLTEWSKLHNLTPPVQRAKRKQKSTNGNQQKRSKVKKNTNAESCPPVQQQHSKDSNAKNCAVEDEDATSHSSSDTIILEDQMSPETYVKLPSMDESPILTSIVKNLTESSHFCANEASSSKSIAETTTKDDNGDDLFKTDSDNFIVSLIKDSRPSADDVKNTDDELARFLEETDSLLQKIG